MTFSNFTSVFPDSRYNNNAGANALFDHLCDFKIVGNLIHESELGLPAAGALPYSLIKTFYSDPIFPLSECSNRQCVGKMIRYILSKYDYIPLKKMAISKKKNVSFAFSSGHIYQKM